MKDARTVFLIYCVTNVINGKKYVGQTTRKIDDRRGQHEEASTKGSKFIFHCALRKYGFENFVWVVLCESVEVDDVDDYERLFIWKYRTLMPNGYNMTAGGHGPRGYRHTTRTKEVLSEISKELWKDDEYRNKILKASKVRYTDEVRLKMSRKKKGRTYEEICGKEGAASRRQKLGKSLKNRVFSDLHRARLSESLKGKKRMTETAKRCETIDFNRVCEFYLMGYTLKELAEFYRVSAAAIRNGLVENGISIRMRGHRVACTLKALGEMGLSL